MVIVEWLLRTNLDLLQFPKRKIASPMISRAPCASGVPPHSTRDTCENGRLVNIGTRLPGRRFYNERGELVNTRRIDGEIIVGLPECTAVG